MDEDWLSACIETSDGCVTPDHSVNTGIGAGTAPPAAVVQHVPDETWKIVLGESSNKLFGDGSSMVQPSTFKSALIALKQLLEDRSAANELSQQVFKSDTFEKKLRECVTAAWWKLDAFDSHEEVEDPTAHKLQSVARDIARIEWRRCESRYERWQSSQKIFRQALEDLCDRMEDASSYEWTHTKGKESDGGGQNVHFPDPNSTYEAWEKRYYELLKDHISRLTKDFEGIDERAARDKEVRAMRWRVQGRMVELERRVLEEEKESLKFILGE